MGKGLLDLNIAAPHFTGKRVDDTGDPDDRLAQREATLALLDRHHHQRRRTTLGADHAYDVAAFVGTLGRGKVTPPIAINGAVGERGPGPPHRDGRTLRHEGHRASQCHRKRIEEVFRRIKAQASFPKSEVRGLAEVTPPSRRWRPPTTSHASPDGR
ncbi:hypothetical protein [Acuticoccus sp.]|uniref:hypothetical protein n=1 Tax=Acuticoccus sp. TaxID=1904378 RepID=UPI003B52D3C9